MSNLVERYAMAKRCGDCAFTPGTDAREKSGIIADLCVESGEPFLCHRRTDDGELAPRMRDAETPILCRGFVDALVARGDRPAWHEAVSKEMLAIANESAETGREIPVDEIKLRVLAAGELADRQATEG